MSMEAFPSERPSGLRRSWPWLVLALTVIPAVWHVVDFEDDVDPEFPHVVRPTFSALPPAAYRLAEPGDTLDRIEIYLAAAGVVLAVGGLLLDRGRELWPALLAIGVGGLWYSATPGPTVDGWYGLGWRTITDPRAPASLRAGLLAAAIVIGAVVAVTILYRRKQIGQMTSPTHSRNTNRLWVTALILVTAGQFEFPGVAPLGYWPRCVVVLGMLAFDLGVLIYLLPRMRSRTSRWAVAMSAPPGWLALVVFGIAATWYHRPLARLKVVVPGRIYISAMPTRRGLEVGYPRLHFRTIINLFPEDTPQRSPLLEDELQFAREHEISYVASPSDPSPAASNAFLSQTLALAQDPKAWPILVHCHGCMDRSPAWMGIYRFLVEGCPLNEIMQEIERHRGYRPKASVILLYNRVLRERGGSRYWADPTAMLLRRCANETLESIQELPSAATDPVNLGAAAGVQGAGRAAGRPADRRTR